MIAWFRRLNLIIDFDINNAMQMASAQKKRLRGNLCAACIYIWVCLLFSAVSKSKAEDFPAPISIADFQKVASTSNDALHSFRIEGVIRAVVRQRMLIALQDRSAAILVGLPTLGDTIRVGERVSVEGQNCSLTPDRLYTHLGLDPVINNDGLHTPQLKSGRIFLNAGKQPIRLEWFNGPANAKLEVSWQGPDVRRQIISSTALWHQIIGNTNSAKFEQGLDFSAYNGNDWHVLPDFTSCTQALTGIATNINASYRARPENTALVFSGYIEVPKSGYYTFYLTSDDGAKLYVGEGISCKVIPPESQSPQPEDLRFSPDELGNHWGELKGNVVFSGYDQDKLKIELATRGTSVPVTILDGGTLFSTNLMHRQIRISGVFMFSHESDWNRFLGVVVPGPEQLEILSPPNEKTPTNNLLTTIAQARQLSPDEASLGIPIKIQGVVIGTSPGRLVLCDSTGGISVHFDTPDNWIGPPEAGEFLEIEGKTIHGDFVPAIMAKKLIRLGNAPMPKPKQPNWDELMNGSLDCEYVEIQGVLTAASTNEMTLLTQDGKITIDKAEARPLPQLPHYSGGKPLVGSVVRLRGGLNYEWNGVTRQIIRGRFYFINPLLSVESTPRPDPFAIPTSTIGDLLWYNPQFSGLQRTKVEGQVIFARPGEYFALDHKVGFRILTPDPVALEAGDLIEAVGFPRVSGSPPVLQEAKIRKIGHAPLPAPVKLSAEQLLSLQHDSTLVQLDAKLINYTTRSDSEIFQLQAEKTHFEAKLNLESSQPLSLSIGSHLQLMGVYAARRPDHLGASTDPFELLLNGPKDVTVIQMPPWWTVRRALTFAGALGAALGLAVVWVTLLRRKVEVRTLQLQKEIEGRQKVERQRLMEQERTRVAQDLHDELGAGLTEMSLFGSLAGRPDIPAVEKNHYLDLLTKSARSLVTGLDEIVWAINPKYDTVGSIATYYSFFAEEFLNLAGITCRLEVAEKLPTIPLDSRARHGVFLALKEALNNVVRHSQASEVTLKVNLVGDQLIISVGDNGCGFECGSGKPGSDGLAGMQNRLQKLGGTCDISSRVGQGTIVEFRLNTAATATHTVV